MVRAVWNGEVIAESDDTMVVEGNHSFPIESVRVDLLRTQFEQAGVLVEGRRVVSRPHRGREGEPRRAARAAGVQHTVSRPLPVSGRIRLDLVQLTGKGSAPSIRKVGEPPKRSSFERSSGSTNTRTGATPTPAAVAATERRSIKSATFGQSSTCNTSIVTGVRGVSSMSLVTRSTCAGIPCRRHRTGGRR